MIGKITRQELHPSLLKYLKDIEDSAKKSTIYISSEEPEDRYDGMLWYNPSEPGSYIWYEGEWHPLCSTTCGPVQPPSAHDLTINLKQAEVVLSDIIEPGIVPLPFLYDPSSGFMQIIANGVLLDSSTAKIDDGCLIKIDNDEIVPKWNLSKQEKTRFLFTYIEQKSTVPNTFLKFHNKKVIVEKSENHKGKIEVKIPQEILTSIQNMHVLLNNVLLTEGLSKGEYIIEKNSIIGEWGQEGVKEDLEFTFLSIENNFSEAYPTSPKIEKETVLVEKGRAKTKMRINSDDYLEVIANGIYVYPSEYTIFNNSIELNEHKWEEGTEVFVKKIGNTKVNVEKLPIKYLDKETIKNKYLDKEVKYIPIAPASTRRSNIINRNTFNVKQRGILEQVFEETRPLKPYLNDPKKIIMMTSNDKMTKDMATLYLNRPDVLTEKDINTSFIFNKLDLNTRRSIASLSLAKGRINGMKANNTIVVDYDNSYSFIPGSNLTVKTNNETIIIDTEDVTLDHVKLTEESASRLRETNFRGAEIFASNLDIIDNRLAKRQELGYHKDDNTIRFTLSDPIENSITLWVETGLDTNIKEVYINNTKLEKYSTESNEDNISHNFVQYFEKTQDKPTLRIEFESSNDEPYLDEEIKAILGYIR